MSETEKNPVDMSTEEIKEEIEVCYESLNMFSKLLGQKAKLGGDVGGGIASRVNHLQEELRRRNGEEKIQT